MPCAPVTVEGALTELAGLAHLEPVESEQAAMYGRVPDDLATEAAKTLALSSVEARVLVDLRRLLAEDFRFEYMDEQVIKDATWRFVVLASFRPDEDHVEAFVAEHARDLMERTCFFPVAHLTVSGEFDLMGARLIPKVDANVPVRVFGPDPRETMACAIAVECVGTDYNKMTVRARWVAEHALRRLRAGMRDEHWVPDQQLHFGLGESVWFDDGAAGWGRPKTMGWDYEPGEDVLHRATSQSVFSLPPSGGTEVEECANRALGWWEQAHLTVDPLMELLFLFFALEAILGTNRGGPKARPLALRRAILSYRTTEHFAHPARVYGLYRDVRNSAVHGSEAPNVADEELAAFSWDARRALNEYIQFARAEGLVKRDEVLEALDADPAVERIAEGFLP